MAAQYLAMSGYMNPDIFGELPGYLSPSAGIKSTGAPVDLRTIQ